MLRYTYAAYFVKYIKVNSYCLLIKLTYTHTIIFRNNGRISKVITTIDIYIDHPVVRSIKIRTGLNNKSKKLFRT